MASIRKRKPYAFAAPYLFISAAIAFSLISTFCVTSSWNLNYYYYYLSSYYVPEEIMSKSLELDRNAVVAIDTTTTSTILTQQQPTKDDDNNNNNNNKRFLVMHIGPHKTASTYLQSSITNNIIPHLQQDNYSYGGRYIPFQKEQTKLLTGLLDEECKREVQKARFDDVGQSVSKLPTCWKDRVVDELERLFKEGKNILLVEEALSDGWFDIPAFQEITRRQGWHVVIVVTYRRLFEWLPSQKNQQEKMNQLRWPTKPLSNDHGWDYARPKLNQKILESKNGAIRKHPIDKILEMYRNFDVEKKILNMYEDPDIMSNLLCNIVPLAANSCQVSRDLYHSANATGVRKNKSVVMDYDGIAVEAVDRGILDKSKFDRMDVVERLRQYHLKNLNGRPLPLECLSQKNMEKLLDYSLRIERELLPAFYETSQHDHREKFWKAQKENKFCSVNATAVLQDPDWKKFFESLRF